MARIAVSSPWQVYWSNAIAGTNVLRAYATDSDGRFGVSAPVSVVINNAPVAVADQTTVLGGTANNAITVLENDYDVNGDSLFLTNLVIVAPTNGSVFFSGDLAFYTPSNGVYGWDRFQYAILDAHGAIATGWVAVVVIPGLELPDPAVAISAPSNQAEVSGSSMIDFGGQARRHDGAGGAGVGFLGD